MDEAALYLALANGKVAGAGLDVFEGEPPPKDNPIFELENVILTPHVAGFTEEAAERIAIAAAKKVVDVLRGRLPELEIFINNQY